jgi:hypothetical protein
MGFASPRKHSQLGAAGSSCSSIGEGEVVCRLSEPCELVKSASDLQVSETSHTKSHSGIDAKRRGPLHAQFDIAEFVR